MSSNTPKEYIKHHEDAAWMANAIAEGKNTKQIAKELHLSYKLVELSLKRFGIKFNSMAPTTVSE